MKQDFVTDTVFKRDVFSETRLGHFAGVPTDRVIRRVVSAAPWWSRPIAWFLARREIRALGAVSGIDGTPQLIRTDRDGIFRSWSDGTPLHLARPADPAFYRDARRLLRELRRRGITHNDLAKPQNWLMTPDGRAAVIDFQLASVHRRKGALYRVMAREDLRHLLKQKRSFARALLTPAECRLLARKSLPARIWLATGKKAYNFVTRRLFDWSDGEGTGDRIERDGPAIRDRLLTRPGVNDVALETYSLPAKGIGLYAFVETGDSDVDEVSLRAALGELKLELLQVVRQLPRDPDGHVRHDLLRLVAMNQMTELDGSLARAPAHAELLRAIAAGRHNLTDRRDTRREAGATAVG